MEQGRILLVEGPDDQHVVWNLCETCDVAECFRVETPEGSGGVNQLLDLITSQVITSGLERLAIIVDADEVGPEARWQAIRDRLLRDGYSEIPENHSPDGSVFTLTLETETPRTIRFGVWIMPDNCSGGMLEDFVARMIPDNDAMLPLIDGFLDDIPEETKRFSDVHRPKARIHTWLATNREPGKPMGQAIKAGYVDTTHESLGPFLRWIDRALVD